MSYFEGLVIWKSNSKQEAIVACLTGGRLFHLGDTPDWRCVIRRLNPGDHVGMKISQDDGRVKTVELVGRSVGVDPVEYIRAHNTSDAADDCSAMIFGNEILFGANFPSPPRSVGARHSGK